MTGRRESGGAGQIFSSPASSEKEKNTCGQQIKLPASHWQDWEIGHKKETILGKKMPPLPSPHTQRKGRIHNKN